MIKNPVVLFKPQGKKHSDCSGASDDDFMLGIQTEFQLEMMKSFGNSAICVDSTHGTNVYEFLLVTVLVVDDFGEGIPVAWLITNKEDRTTLTYFFQCLYARTDLIASNTFMSDDAPQYWNAWSSVYGTNQTRKLLCIWHVDRSWRRALQRHVHEKSEQVAIYHSLRVLLNEKEIVEFRLLLQQFMSILSTSQPHFYEYFKSHYAQRAEQWTTCYRSTTLVNTNMHVEAFHRLLKVVYLQGKQNRRLDHLLSVLFRISRDKTFERISKLHKGKSTQSIRVE